MLLTSLSSSLHKQLVLAVLAGTESEFRKKL
jgi:hypothetical protein